jgi:hypothetical protein
MLKGANNILSLAEVRKEWRMKSVHGIGRSLRLMGRGRKVLDTVSRKSKGGEQGRRARELVQEQLSSNSEIYRRGTVATCITLAAWRIYDIKWTEMSDYMSMPLHLLVKPLCGLTTVNSTLQERLASV